MFWFNFHSLIKIHWDEEGLNSLAEPTWEIFDLKEIDLAWLDKARKYGI